MHRFLVSLLCGVTLVVASGCSDPYTQTVEPPDSPAYSGFSRAMKKLPTEEKNLVNDYVARKQREGVRPAGITLREAMDDQRRHEREEQDLGRQLIGGVVKIAEAFHGANPVGRAPVPAQPAAAPQPPPLAPAPSPVPTDPPATLAPPMPPSASPPVGAAPSPPAGRPAPITGLELSDMIRRIEEHPMPTDRLNAVKGYTSGHWFTTAQALALADTTIMPNEKVEALGALYPRVVDPDRFDSAYGILPFPAQRDALRHRIEALRGR